MEEFLQGNEACVQGALASGCRFYAGYPITPSTEIAEGMAETLPKAGGIFIQMEDEMAALGAVIGAVWTGARAMTATSGPGLSLMVEHIGYAAMTETPCVIVDIQRAGPSTGQATKTASGDVMQARWGSHGDYEIIALAPWSVQEMYDLTIQAFNLAETYRVPVLLLSDETIAHLREKVSIHRSFTLVERPQNNKRSLPPFGDPQTNEITPMPGFGQGRKLLVTGSTHDEFGYRRTQSPEAQAKLVSRLCHKIRKNADKIWESEEYSVTQDTKVLLIAYGFTARSALEAVRLVRQQGIKAGLIRLKTLWPFPENTIKQLSPNITKIIVPEMNQGQIIREIQRFTRCEVIPYNKTDGTVITPGEIARSIEQRA